MNIFILDRDQTLCARYHLDKHVVKMPLETAQMLCTALVCHGIEAKYKVAHKNHPCSKWVRQTKSNFEWLCLLGIALCKEYSYRYDNRIHKCELVIADCMGKANGIPDGELTDFAQAMPDEYKHLDAVEAYRAYYMGAKTSLASWKNRETPEWWKSNGN